ncbi:ATP phosphoribosyltransferase regulatory subunit [Roseburia sp. AM51-8]|jgi:ATP phosphoribosyltransferase regulatory subunit|uniref:ATP phosphoribosyltransferase regulatory subunit n=1 Tax=Roseburia sp. AM51-8 TaxID=2292366 RepID=UPI000E508436|nr:ATP phosphoribosyltransferase regulatory subunit [Roseburia sp. AM51-8]RHQ02479.1 ATP phosphoribosyltransferase regulatory subunit [Roseburia sp. AM51-8]
MQNKRLHTPEGVRDIYNDECEKKHYILDRMRQVIQSYGYRFIETPTFEFFDIFGQEVGTTPSKDLYKFFDREGNTLVLRPDMTPSIARAASKYFPIETEPVRLCYEGNVFINNNSYQGRLKESTQLGVEFIGENSVDADGEIIALVVNNLKAAGLEQFQISIGHADLFRQLMKAADFDAEAEETLRDLILNKNFFGVDEFLERHQVTDDLRSLFSMLGKMYASPKEWAGMKEIALRFPGVADALSYLQELYELLEVYDVTKYVSFELGLISSYSYYTGILFSGYTFGSGEPIVKGGRYDGLLSYFGKEAPAIGFALMVDQLLLALERQKIAISAGQEAEIILYTPQQRKIAATTAEELRNAGKIVRLHLMNLDSHSIADYRQRYQGQKIIVLEDE